MSSLAIAFIVLGSLFATAMIAMFLVRVPLDNDKEIVKLVTGLVATLAALVLGLLISSAKSSFDAMEDALIQVAVKLVLLDRRLAASDRRRETFAICSSAATPQRLIC